MFTRYYEAIEAQRDQIRQDLLAGEIDRREADMQMAYLACAERDPGTFDAETILTMM